MKYIWTAFMVVVLIVLFILLLKFLFYNYVLLRGDDSIPILPGSGRNGFWIEYDRLRQQGIRSRQPPPDFDEALRNSRPVSYLEVDEEPPPTYDDFLKSCSPSPNSTLASSPSPLAQGVDYAQGEARGVAGDNFVLNPFENDFVIDLQGNSPDSDSAALVDGVFGNLGDRRTSKPENGSNESEA